MIVLDASAALSALLHDGPARRTVAAEQLHAPHLVDTEVAHALRRRVGAGELTPQQGWAALSVMQRLAVTRYPMFSLSERVWELRENVSAYDACYVALAELLSCPLLTADARLSRVPSLSCVVSLVPR